MSDDLSLVIFDMDGTLIDSQAVIIAAMRRTFASAGLPAPTDDATRAIIGLSLVELFQVLAPGEDPHRMADLYRTSFVAVRAETGGEAASPLFPGAQDALSALAARGWLLSVATGKSRRGLCHAMESHGWNNVFTFPQTADDARSKPDPEMVEICMSRHGVAPGRTVMVGDTSFDMQMARAAGAHAIGVAWGYHPVASLWDAGAEIVIERYDQLEDAVAKLLEET